VVSFSEDLTILDTHLGTLLSKDPLPTVLKYYGLKLNVLQRPVW
jgi:hypothetical protein